MADGQQVAPSHASRRLSLDEVRMADLPASYQGFGERLVYLNGTIYDASDPSSPTAVCGIADHIVGLEYGWQHAGDCSCHLCSRQPAHEAA
jgi:hypothetical protein